MSMKYCSLLSFELLEAIINVHFAVEYLHIGNSFEFYGIHK